MKITKANKAALINTGIRFGLPVLGIGAGLLILRKRLKRNQDGTSSAIAPSIKDTVIDKQNLTISTSDAALFANTLYGAMLNFGTDEDAIFNTIDQIQTKDDMLLVIKAFGMRMFLGGTRAAFLGQKYNLIGWLRFELTKKELSKIKPKFNSWGIPL